MYHTPELECYGTLRGLTLGGGAVQIDANGPDSAGNSGCQGYPNGSYFCTNS